MREIETNKALLRRGSNGIVDSDWIARTPEQIRKDLIKTAQTLGRLRKRKPLGLSAMQIGEYLRIFIVRDRLGFYHTFINPLIVETMGDKHINYETCLSFPDQCFSVFRYNKIRVRYTDMHQIEHERIFKNRYARQIQHEIDHLNGVVPEPKQFKLGEEYMKKRG